MANSSNSMDVTFQSNGSVEGDAWRSKSYNLLGSETDTETDDGWSVASESETCSGSHGKGWSVARPARNSKLASTSLPLAHHENSGSRGRTLSNSKSTPDFQAEDFKESSGVSSMSSSPRSFISSRSCMTLSDCLLGDSSDSYESENSLELLSSAPNFVASSPLADRMIPSQVKGTLQSGPVVKCPYSYRRDFCRDDCRFGHEAMVQAPLEMDSQSYGISKKVKLDFTTSTLQQREHLRDWPKSPYLRTHAMYQFMISSTLYATSSKRLEPPCTSNGLLDADAVYPCTIYRPCLIDSLILAEGKKANGQSGAIRMKNRTNVPWF